MCHFITAILPSAAAHAGLDAIARKYGRQLKPLSSPSIERQIRPDQRYFLTTIGHCDCGTVLGSDHQKPHRAPDWAGEERRLLKKGWSKAKVARALAQKREHSAESVKASDAMSATELASWVQLVADVLDSGKTCELGLLLYSCEGPLDEEISLQGSAFPHTGSPVGQALTRMLEDVVYVFRREGFPPH